MNEKVKAFIRDKIVSLKDDLQHYSMVEKDKVKEKLLTLEIEDFNNVLGALNNLEELIKGKDEYIAKLCNDRAELKEEIKRLDSQYKNIHNTKVKVPLCDILNGLSRAEKEKVIEDIYYSQAERQDFYDNKISKLETELKELKEFVKVLCKMKIVDSNHKIYGINENDIALIKKVMEKYGK